MASPHLPSVPGDSDQAGTAVAKCRVASLIQQALIFGLGSLAVATPYLAVILAAIVVVWIRAARKLNVQFIDAMEKVGEEV